MDEVTLPTPPEGFEYKLVRKKEDTTSRVLLKDKDPSELTPKQLADLKYREQYKEKVREKNRTLYEKNKEKIKEQKRLQYQDKKKKEESLSTSGQSQ